MKECESASKLRENRKELSYHVQGGANEGGGQISGFDKSGEAVIIRFKLEKITPVIDGALREIGDLEACCGRICCQKKIARLLKDRNSVSNQRSCFVS